MKFTSIYSLILTLSLSQVTGAWANCTDTSVKTGSVDSETPEDSKKVPHRCEAVCVVETSRNFLDLGNVLSSYSSGPISYTVQAEGKTMGQAKRRTRNECEKASHSDTGFQVDARIKNNSMKCAAI